MSILEAFPAFGTVSSTIRCWDKVDAHVIADGHVCHSGMAVSFGPVGRDVHCCPANGHAVPSVADGGITAYCVGVHTDRGALSVDTCFAIHEDGIATAEGGKAISIVLAWS